MTPKPTRSSQTAGKSNEIQLYDLLDECRRRSAAGERIEIEGFVADYPEFEMPLRRLLPLADVLAAMPEKTTDETAQRQLPTTEPASRTLGDFRIIREIGRGGMGVVYEAEQLSLERRVALKVLPLASLMDERQLKRFKNEAMAAASLKHPNIVSVHHVGCERSVHFYAMELVAGCDLATTIRAVHRQVGPESDPLRESRNELSANPNADTRPVAQLSTQLDSQRSGFYYSVAKLAIQAAEALHYAHQEGIVHRDIKPANLLLGHNGNIHIADFGLARIQENGELTRTGDLVGTLRYMSPEQVVGNHVVDDRTDVYSLGLTLYELVSGHAAFNANSRQQLLKSVVEREPASLSRLDPQIPRDLRIIIEKAISKEPVERYADAQAFADDLKCFVEHRTIRARRASGLSRVSRFARRNPTIAMLLTATAILLGVIAIGATSVAWQYSQLSQRQAAELRAQELASYANGIELAKSATDRGRFVEAEARLIHLAPRDPVDDDMRGVEWYWIWQNCHPIEIVRTFELAEAGHDIGFSPDGKRLAVGITHSTIPIWGLGDPPQSPPKEKLSLAEGHPFFAATTGNRLLVGDSVGVAQVWNWNDLQSRKTFRLRKSPGPGGLGPGEGVWSVDTDLNEQFVAAGGQLGDNNPRGCLAVWDLNTQELLFRKEKLDGLQFVLFDDNGDLVAVQFGTQQLCRYSVPEGELVETIDLHGRPTYAAISADRRQIALGMVSVRGGHEDTWVETRQVHDLSRARHLFNVSSPNIRSVAFAHAGDQLTAGDLSGQLWKVDLASGRVAYRQLHDGRILSVTYSPDDSLIATTGADQITHLVRSDWSDSGLYSPLVLISGAQRQCASTFLSDDRLAIAGDQSLVVRHVASGNLIETWDVDAGKGAYPIMAANTHAKLVAIGRGQWPYDRERCTEYMSRIALLNAENGESVASFDVPGGLYCSGIEISPDGRYLTRSNALGAFLIDRESDADGTRHRQKQFDNPIYTSTFSLDSQVWIVGAGSRIHFLSTETLEPVRGPIDTGFDHLKCVRSIPESKNLAVIGADDILHVVDSESGRLISSSTALALPPPNYSSVYMTLAVSHDGGRIGVGCTDGIYRIFRSADCAKLAEVPVPEQYAWSSFSPSGRSLVIASGPSAFVMNGNEATTLSGLSRRDLERVGRANRTTWHPTNK